MKRTVISGLALAAIATTGVALASPQQPDKQQAPIAGQPLHLDGFASGRPAILPPHALGELNAREVADPRLDSTVQTTTRYGWTTYLTQAANAACLALTDDVGGASVKCVSGGDLDSGKAQADAAVTGCDGGSPETPPTCRYVTFYGIAPDGVTRVQAELASGTMVNGTVENNTYLLRVPMAQEPVAFGYSLPDGTRIAHAVPFGPAESAK